MTERPGRWFLGVMVLLSAASVPAVASRPRAIVAVPVTSAPTVLAYSCNLGKFAPGGDRRRIVQLCAIVMCIALYILVRKLH